MIEFTLETQIDRPATEVFDYVTDPALLPTWQTTTISSVPDGPMAVGTRLREVHRGPAGKEIKTLVEVAEYDPGRAFALRVIEGTPVHLRITLEGNTRLLFLVHGELAGAQKLLSPLLSRVLRKQFAAQLATLKDAMEAPVLT